MSDAVARGRQRLAGDAGRLRSLGLLAATSWRADPRRSLGALATTVTDQGGQLLAIYAIKLVIDAASAGDRGRAITWGVVIGAAVALSYAANAIGSTVSNALRERTAMAFEAKLVALVGALPGIEHFERPELLDRVELVRQDRWALGAVVQSVLNILNVALQLVGTTLVLASVSPVLLLLPIAAVAPWATSLWSDKIYKRGEDETAPENRLAVRLQAQATDPASAAELRVHGFASLVLDRHRQAHEAVIDSRKRVAVKTGLLGLAGDAVLIAAQMAAVVLVVRRAVGGATTPGDVVLTVTLALRLRYQVYWLVGSLERMLRTLRTVGRLAWLEDEVDRATQRMGECRADVSVPDRLSEGISFENVTFRYPDTSVDVLAGVDLFLPAGTTVAVVGENGAGKTTIVKLLCRFYELTEGRITVDGEDLRRFPIEEWRARLSGAFQDHARLEFLAQETVGVGRLEAINDAEAVLGAIERAGASAVLRSLPDGLSSQLGTRFEDGVELSGGQWQQLALGRGMMRTPTAPLLLLLDEPTAALDPGTEHRLFERYAAAARSASADSGAITVLVSHRFSTVRMADLIVVVADGRVLEAGSHDALMAAGGLYSELYGLQARAYGP
ncbi:MAG TPA: ABC transporter ATP-binding protein [Acidimicrobiales bacterium]|nr:ABC transporter ATP-binding protein [Acidimicrobiales bacterium]